MKKILLIIIFGFLININYSFAENNNFEEYQNSVKNNEIKNQLIEKIKNIKEKKEAEKIKIEIKNKEVPESFIKNKEENTQISEKKNKTYSLSFLVFLVFFSAFIFSLFWKKSSKNNLIQNIAQNKENELLENKRLEKRIVPNWNEDNFWKKMNEITREYIEKLSLKKLENLTNIEIIENFKVFFEKNIELKEILLEVNKWIYWRSRKDKDKLAEQLHILINKEIENSEEILKII